MTGFPGARQISQRRQIVKDAVVFPLLSGHLVHALRSRREFIPTSIGQSSGSIRPSSSRVSPCLAFPLCTCTIAVFIHTMTSKHNMSVFFARAKKHFRARKNGQEKHSGTCRIRDWGNTSVFLCPFPFARFPFARFLRT